MPDCAGRSHPPRLEYFGRNSAIWGPRPACKIGHGHFLCPILQTSSHLPVSRIGHRNSPCPILQAGRTPPDWSNSAEIVQSGSRDRRAKSGTGISCARFYRHLFIFRSAKSGTGIPRARFGRPVVPPRLQYFGRNTAIWGVRPACKIGHGDSLLPIPKSAAHIGLMQRVR